MKKFLLLFGLLTLSTAVYAINAQAKQTGESIDQIVAIVNDDVVTSSELSHDLRIAKMRIAQEHLPATADATLRKQVLDQIINKKLQLQLAKQVGINITEQDLEKAIASIAQRNNMSVNDLYLRLNQEGMSTADYKSEMREQITMQKIQQQEVINHINISPDEVNNFIQSKHWQNNSAKEYHIQDFLIPLSDAPTTNEITAAKAHAESLLAKANKSGPSLLNVLADSSVKPNDLGWRKLPEIPSAFTESVAKMQAKEITGPIQTSNGFHILRLAEVRALASESATPDRKQVENLLLQQKFEEALQNWQSKLRSQAFINTNPIG